MPHARRASSALLRAPSSRARPDADVISRAIAPAPCRLPPAAPVTASAPRRAVIECIVRLAELCRHESRRSCERAPRKSLLENNPHPSAAGRRMASDTPRSLMRVPVTSTELGGGRLARSPGRNGPRRTPESSRRRNGVRATSQRQERARTGPRGRRQRGMGSRPRGDRRGAQRGASGSIGATVGAFCSTKSAFSQREGLSARPSAARLRVRPGMHATSALGRSVSEPGASPSPCVPRGARRPRGGLQLLGRGKGMRLSPITRGKVRDARRQRAAGVGERSDAILTARRGAGDFGCGKKGNGAAAARGGVREQEMRSRPRNWSNGRAWGRF